MDKAFNPFLEFDKRPVIRKADHLAPDLLADRVLFLDILPRVRGHLFQPERYPAPVDVDVENLYRQFIPDSDQFGGMADPSPGHISNVKEPVHTTKVYERPEVGDVLDHALPLLADLYLGKQLPTLVISLLFQENPPRDDDVPPALVEFDDLETIRLPYQGIEVADAPEPDLGAWQKRIDPQDVHDHSTLDLP